MGVRKFLWELKRYSKERIIKEKTALSKGDIMSFYYRDYINDNHEPDNRANHDLESMRLLAKDITHQHADITLDQRVALFRDLAEDFNPSKCEDPDLYDDEDVTIFESIEMIAEEELFPKTQLCDLCDCQFPMSVCAVKCPIYRKYHR